MGDFNIPSLDSPLYNAVSAKGLQMVEAIAKKDIGSNLAKDKRYDQILHYQSIPGLYVTGPPTKAKFTCEMSGHLPIRVQLNTDTGAERLDRIIAAA